MSDTLDDLYLRELDTLKGDKRFLATVQKWVDSTERRIDELEATGMISPEAMRLRDAQTMGGRVRHKVIVRNEQLRNRAAAICATIPLDEEHEVVIRPHKRNRSEQANRYYWAILTIIGADLGMSKEALHEEYKQRFLIPIFCRDDPDFSAMITAVEEAGMMPQVVGMVSTAKCNTAQFTEYLEDIKHSAADLGIRLPFIEDY